MRSFIKYFLFTIIGLLLINLTILSQYQHEYPKALGPSFSSNIRKDIQNTIEIRHPEVIILGNSIVKNSVDESLFQDLSGRRTYLKQMSGSTSALWYLVIKNNIVTASFSPKAVIIVFLNNWLTKPDLSVDGSYLPMIDEYAGENETLLIQKAYLNRINPFDGFFVSHIPLLSEQLSITSKLADSIKYFLPYALFKCDRNCLDSAMDDVFNQDNLTQNLISNPFNENNQYPENEWNFPDLIQKSFLPDFISLLKEKEIHLILVRSKDMAIPEIQDEPSIMQKYFLDLKNYLKANQVDYYDFSHDPALTPDLFIDEMHLNSHGMKVFTSLMASRILLP